MYFYLCFEVVEIALGASVSKRPGPAGLHETGPDRRPENRSLAGRLPDSLSVPKRPGLGQKPPGRPPGLHVI